MSKGLVLAIDDERDMVALVRYTLEKNGYEVVGACDGNEGLHMALDRRPQVIVLDRMMPGLDGMDVCRALRENHATCETPILMLTALGESKDMVDGLAIGADDYMAKPFDLPEFVARVDALVRRSMRGLDANPLTRLPGNRAITEFLNAQIRKQADFAAFYADLDRFKAYNDRYGYAKGDTMIFLAARCLGKALDATDSPIRFLGHVGGDDFVGVCGLEAAESVAHVTFADFGRESLKLYSEADRDRGWVESENRQGQHERIPLVTMTVVATSTALQRFVDASQVSEVLSDLKGHAKRRPGGFKFCCDRRKQGP